MIFVLKECIIDLVEKFEMKNFKSDFEIIDFSGYDLTYVNLHENSCKPVMLYLTERLDSSVTRKLLDAVEQIARHGVEMTVVDATCWQGELSM